MQEIALPGGYSDKAEVFFAEKEKAMDLNANLKGGWGCVGYAIGITILIFAGIVALAVIEFFAKHGY